MGEWISPKQAIADAVFSEGERVEARFLDGGSATICFGHVEDDEGVSWLSFYDDDGQEVIPSDIEGVRTLVMTDQ